MLSGHAVEPPTIPSRLAHGERLLRGIEAAGVFLLGVAVMNFLYAWSVGRAGAEIGVPEHDSYYHVAMAQMLPQHGLLRQFPWLQFVYFRNQGSDFVSHHWGFHLLLLPFVKVAEWTTGNPLDGGRWAMSAVFGANVLLFHFLLRHIRAPLHWLWIGLFLLLPDQFFARHGFVRAIGSSFLFMQLALLCLFNRRWILAGLTLAAYVHLYLGAVMYGPVVVATYALAQVIGPKEDRTFPWMMTLIAAAGWLVGVVTYPYSAGMFEFLRMQVFGSGLSPDIEVGREWKPYSDPWFVVSMCAPLLAVWVSALVWRLRWGPRLDVKETALLLLQFGFLLLMLKARRFVEYWPPLCLLSAAYLAAGPLREILGSAARAWARRDAVTRHALVLGGLAALAVATGILVRTLAARPAGAMVIAEWRLWLAAVLPLLLPTLVRIWAGADRNGAATPIGKVVIGPALGGLALAAIACSILLAAYGSAGLPAGRLTVPGVGWALLVAAFGLVPLAARSIERRAAPVAIPGAAARTATAVLVALALPAGVLAIGAPSLASASRQVRCYYDLDEIRGVMSYLARHSRPGDVVFTDDWDIFPVFFYHNRHNHYIVGLDPKFTHQREPELWERYVKISRGEVPSSIRFAAARDGARLATVGLADIRERFRARYVVCDRDHRRLADALAAAPQLAEFVYPGESYARARTAEYVVFRVRDAGEQEARLAQAGPPDTLPGAALYLSGLEPVLAEQGWGDLGADRTVDGNAIRMRGRRFERGLGSHAPSKLLYNIPPGYRWFEAIIGIDDETRGNGSAVLSVYLDGVRAFESPVLVGGAEPVLVRIPLGDARQVLLQADPTPDGQRFDHVNWADARFTVDSSDDPRVARDAPSPATTAERIP